jgi:hypothetical protein
MPRIAASLRRTVLVVLTGISTVMAAPDLPDAKSFVEQARAGKLDPQTYDFEAAGFFRLPDRMQWQVGIFSALGVNQPGAPPPCSTAGHHNGAIMAWTQLAAQSTDADEWKVSAAKIRARLAELDDILKKSAPETSSADPVVRELLLRFARDQAVRIPFSQLKWTEGLPPAAANAWMLSAGSRVTAIDCDNTAWLKTRLAKIGWFTIPKYGEAADTAAWHLVQHADRDSAFQRAMLEKLQALPPGETNGKRLGLLFDRVARAEGHLQRYGTQGTCKDGQWTPFESEDPEHLDQRRAAIGMDPIAEHMKTVSREACPH